MSQTATPPTWDLTSYFDRFDSDEQRAFAAAIEADIARHAATLDGIGPIAESPDSWRVLLLELEDLGKRLGHLGSFLGCLGAADVRDEAVSRARARLASTGAEVTKLWVQVEAAFRAADEASFEALISHPELASARYLLTRVRERAAKAMPPELEALSADLGVTGFGAWGRLYNQLAGSLEFELERPDGSREQVPMSRRNSLLEDPDPQVRAAAFEGANAAWAASEVTAAAALNAIAGRRLMLYRRRGIEHFLEPALHDSAIEQRTLDAMLEACRLRRELPRRFLRAKARLLGMERLRWCDLHAPMPIDARAGVDWPAAEARVSGAFSSTYPALGEFARMAFDKRWIDAEPRPGKSPGGFCTSSQLSLESRIFMTYGETLGDVQTLAHELGHAFHNWLMREQRPWARRYPMTLAETASTFAETLLTDALLEDDALPASQRLEVLATRLDNCQAFVLNIPMRYQFEHALYSERAAGELSISRLKELVCEAQRDCYGDALDPDQLDPYFWASKLHFYITGVSFYNFPYTFGYLFSLGIYARAKAAGPAFLAVFERLLSQTGSASAEQVARDALDVDLGQPDFWLESLDTVEADLDAFESLAAELLPSR